VAILAEASTCDAIVANEIMNSTDPTSFANPYDPPPTPRPGPGVHRLLFAIVWVALVLIVGAVIACHSALEFGELGMIAVWPIGWAGGFVAAKILAGKSKLVGALLVATCFSIAVIAELNWIHEEIEGADESWSKTISLLPAFVRQFKLAAIVALIFAGFGALSAWRAVTVRYVRVRVDE